MLKLFFILLLPLSLFASKILSYNIYDRSDRVDVMLTFDTPYRGKIKQSHSGSKLLIKLEGASIESPKIKKLSSKFLRAITLTPKNNSTQIVANIPSKNVKLIAAKTADGYGLRLRFTTKGQTKDNTNISTNEELSSLPTQKESGMTQSYIIVIAILLIGIALLFYLRKKMPQPQEKKEKKNNTNWLFNQTQTQNMDTKQNDIPKNSTADGVSIRFQKVVDANNSVVMLDFGPQSYLVLMGNGNILLDKFYDNKPTTQQEFETILQDRHEELEAFLYGKKESRFQDGKEALETYKERAASMIYKDEA
jgi:hypothetical protein